MRRNDEGWPTCVLTSAKRRKRAFNGHDYRSFNGICFWWQMSQMMHWPSEAFPRVWGFNEIGHLSVVITGVIECRDVLLDEHGCAAIG